MKNETWLREYAGEFAKPNEHERVATVLWCRYYVLCESYDATVCTGRREPDGTAVPMTPGERRAINHHAHRLHEEIVREARAVCIPAETFEQTRREVMEWPLSRQRETLEAEARVMRLPS